MISRVESVYEQRRCKLPSQILLIIKRIPSPAEIHSDGVGIHRDNNLVAGVVRVGGVQGAREPADVLASYQL